MGRIHDIKFNISQIFSNNSVMSTDKPSPLLAIKTSFDVAACHLFYA